MLNSTKTWQERFDEMSEIEEFWGLPYDHLVDEAVKQFISDLRKKDEEELIKIVSKLKADFETRVAWKNLKPESVGYNKCALKISVKIKQVKQLIKDYYEN